ncbi:MAG: oxidoreductase [Verrucomicrobiae bacterium]|nr:oxidoreductase [Verrucomicrobiae bacterium]
MIPVLLALLALLLTGGLAAAWSCPRGASRIAAGGTAVAGLLSGATAVQTLAGAAPAALTLPWSVPLGAFSMGMDPLSAWFVLALAFLAPLAAVFGVGSLRDEEASRRARTAWGWFNLLVASMLLTLTARNGMLFLAAWEMMTLSSFFLVMHEHERASTRDAGWIYLVASHVGTAFLFAFFVILGRGTTMDFTAFGPPATGGALFLLALVGFGTKAGLAPLHVWLPEAHPAAPSHVSALMSGVMIKLGIYGLLRTLDFLGEPQAWWGWLLVVAGTVSAGFGVLLALGQRDLKRLLAYSSVENVGILAAGLGLGVIAARGGHPLAAALAVAGALIHIWNHACFKSLLFLGAGAVRHAAGTTDLDLLGGLLKRMPVTGASFLAGAAALAALPPLGGFLGEFLILLAALRLALFGGMSELGAGALAIAGLGLAGGLAAACFARAAGMAFLGEPRAPGAAGAREASKWMTRPMEALATTTLAASLFAPLALRAAGALVRNMSWLPDGAASSLAGCGRVVWGVCLGSALLVGLSATVFLFRARRRRGRPTRAAGTWDCGYAAPTARMQYTASSFSEPLTSLFRAVVRPGERARPPEKRFPAPSAFSSTGKDLFRGRVFVPVFRAVSEAAEWVRRLQQGRAQLYVLYVALAALALLVWKLR